MDYHKLREQDRHGEMLTEPAISGNDMLPGSTISANEMLSPSTRAMVAFGMLKAKMATTPVLKHFDVNKVPAAII